MTNSNIDVVIASLHAWVDSFDFQRPGIDQSLGRDIVNDIAMDIQERGTQDKAGPDGPWRPNTQEVAERKEKYYGVVDQPNVETGQMLSLVSLKGSDTMIESHSITMKYGTGTTPTRTATGQGKVRKNPKTDREKAHYAHTGQSKKNIIRAFYGWTQQAAEKVRTTIVDALNHYIRESNARR